MPSYIVCSQLLIKWKMWGGVQNSLPRSSLTCVHTNNIIMTMNRMIKKAALGGPSSDETFPLRVLSFTQHNYPARMRKG